MKNKLIYKILLYIFTILSLLNLGLFNFYMSNYYNNINNNIFYATNPCIIFLIIIFFILVQLWLAFKVMNNK